MSYGDEELQRMRNRDNAKAIERLTAERDSLTVRLADMSNDYHRWHDAYIDLKYPDCGKREPDDPDVIPILEQPERYVAYYRDILRRIAKGWETPKSLAEMALSWQIERPPTLSEAGEPK